MGLPKGPIPFSQPEVDALREHHAKGYVVGLGKVTGLVERKDIDVLLKTEQATFNLYAQALYDLQTKEEFIKSPMGYFQLAGIHDLPFSNGKIWNNTVKANGEWGGYCRHSTVFFPTWHRPYLTAMEQSLYLRMVDIAKSYTKAEDQTTYLLAAQKFRLPYWDYYRPRDFDSNFPGVVRNRSDTNFPYRFGIPQIFIVSEVMVRKAPSNEWTSIPNPFKSFKFPKTNGMTDADWGDGYSDEFRSYTWRYDPNIQDANLYAATMKTMDNVIQKARASNLTNIHHMLVYPDKDGSAYSEFENFATNRQLGPGQKAYGSLEAIHNNVHVYVGNRGHMAQGVSSFDPVFWMHHANIDRWLAVWEAINQNKVPGLTDGEVLAPFLKSANTYWKASDAHDTETFGYTYPDIDKQDPAATTQNFIQLEAWSIPNQPQITQFQDWVPPEAPAERQPLDLSTAWVYSDAKIGYKKLSTPSPNKLIANKMTLSHRQATNTVAAAEISLKEAAPGAPEAPMGILSTPSAPPTEKTWQWYVDMEVERMALNGPFGIYYFIGAAGGEVTALPEDYLVAPTLAAFSYNFTSRIDNCANCAKQGEEGIKITSTEVLTPMLIDYIRIGDLRSLDPTDVKPFLVDRLRWRVLTIDGEKKDPRELAESHGLILNISHSLLEESPEERRVIVAEHPDVIEQIISHASPAQGTTA